MIAGCDGSADALLLPHRPVLLKGLCAINGWGVGTCAGIDIVSAAVGIDSALELSTTGGIVGSEGFAC